MCSRADVASEVMARVAAAGGEGWAGVAGTATVEMVLEAEEKAWVVAARAPVVVEMAPVVVVKELAVAGMVPEVVETALAVEVRAAAAMVVASAVVAMAQRCWGRGPSH